MGKLLRNKKLLVVAVVLLAGAAFAAKTFLLAPAPVDEKRLAREKGPTYVIQEPFVVNLADRGDTSHFAKVGIALRLSKLSESKLPAGGEGGTAAPRLEEEPEIQDIVNGVIASRTSAELLTARGRREVKEEIVRLVNARTDLKIVEVYYTSIAVQ